MDTQLPFMSFLSASAPWREIKMFFFLGQKVFTLIIFFNLYISKFISVNFL